LYLFHFISSFQTTGLDDDIFSLGERSLTQGLDSNESCDEDICLS